MAESDMSIRPESLLQHLAGHYLPGSPQQQLQDLKGLFFQADALTLLAKLPGLQINLKRSKSHRGRGGPGFRHSPGLAVSPCIVVIRPSVAAQVPIIRKL